MGVCSEASKKENSSSKEKPSVKFQVQNNTKSPAERQNFKRNSQRRSTTSK